MPSHDRDGSSCRTSRERAVPARAPGNPAAQTPINTLLRLQATAGNRAAHRLVKGAGDGMGSVIQRKLQIGHGPGRKTFWSDHDLKAEKDSVVAEIKKRRTGKVRAVWSVLKRWADEGTHDFDTWPDAVDAALSEVIRKERSKRDHSPERPMSPYSGDQQDDLDHLSGPGRTAEHMKPGRKWNELKIHGQLGEYGHRKVLKAAKIRHSDANDALGYNAPGIDTLIDRDKAFGQSKMHLAEGLTMDDVATAYLAHVANAPDYSRTLLSKMLLESGSGKKMRENLEKLADEWKNPTLLKLTAYFRDEDWIKPKDEIGDVLEPSVDLHGKVTHVEPVQLVADAMVFPVPSDVYEYLKATYPEFIGRFEALPGTLYDYRKVKAGMQFRTNKYTKTEEEKDPDFT